MDVTELLGGTFIQDQEQVLHANVPCDKVDWSGRGTLNEKILTSIHTELCEQCWVWGLEYDQIPLAQSAMRLTRAERNLEALRRAEPRKRSLQIWLLSTDLEGTVSEHVHAWGRELLGAKETSFEELFGSEQRRIRQEILTQWPQNGKEGVLYVSTYEMDTVAAGQKEVLLPWIVPAHPADGLVLRGPLEILTKVEAALQKIIEDCEAVRVAELDGDDDETIELALSLLDEESEGLWDISQAFAAARAVEVGRTK